jgi:tetratricopeptide (TPR) repeat protein
LLLLGAAFMTPFTPAALSAEPPAATSATLAPEQKKVETNVAKLLARAQMALRANDFEEALSQYGLAVDVLEDAYGREHERVAEPLDGIVATLRAQYDYEVLHRGHRSSATLGQALKAQKRIVEIYAGKDDVDPGVRVNALTRLGDCYLYLKESEDAMASYREAWQLQARLVSSESADALFAETEMIGLFVAHNPGGADRNIVVTYDVGADARVTVVDVQGDDSGGIRRSMRQAYEQTRARPRIAGGEAVAVGGLSATWRYARDGTITRVQ